MRAFRISGGGAGIRTLGAFTLNGFQDRRFRPLSHPSGRGANYTELYITGNPLFQKNYADVSEAKLSLFSTANGPRGSLAARLN